MNKNGIYLYDYCSNNLNYTSLYGQMPVIFGFYCAKFAIYIIIHGLIRVP